MAKYLLSIALIFFFTTAEALNRSGVSLDSVLTKQQTENLYVLAKTWGFLKYHHPDVANGKTNFDDELFRLMQPIANAASANKRSELLLEWINSLGNENDHRLAEQRTSKDVHIKPGLDWLNDRNLFSDALISKLNNIYLHRNNSDNAYVKLMPGVLNPNFDGEQKYADMAADDDGFRMLALFRYWNIIEYFYPSKYLIKEDWNEVLRESIPQFAAARTMTGYKLNCLKLISRIHDTHASISGDKEIGLYFGKKYAMARAKLVEGKLIVYAFTNDSLAKDDPLQIGDELLTINNKTIFQCKKEIEPFIGTSNESAANRNFASFLLLRGNSETLDITFDHNGETRNGKLKLYPMEVFNNSARKILDSPSYRFLNDSTGYITLATIKHSDLPAIFKTFKNTRGIVIDIRNYPAEFMPFDMGYYLKPSASPFVKFTNGNISDPGLFTFKYTLSNGSKNSGYYKGKIVILVDERTQSQAEYTTMALRTAPNAIVMGSQTAGADGNVSSAPFPGGFSSYISGIGVFYPDGKETQGIGIVPDIIVKPTIEGVKKGVDEVLEKAIAYIARTQ